MFKNMFETRELSNKQFQINALDGLRGLAVLCVFLSHLSNAGIFLLPFANFSGIGKSGVFLFFVLSSFLLTLPFIKSGAEAKNLRFVLNYASRRFFRIYPLYSIYLLTGLLTSLISLNVLHSSKLKGIPFYLTVQDFLEHLFLMQGKDVTWSIVVEFRYYFLLPLLALTFAVIFKNRLLPSIALTAGLVVASLYVWPPAQTTVDDPRLGPYLPIFLMGSLLALLFYRWQESALSHNKRALLVVEGAGLLALTILFVMTPSVLSRLLGVELSFDYNHKMFVLFGLLWSVVLFACLAGVGTLGKFFEMPFLRYLGFISFSFYLLHTLVTRLLVYRVSPNLPLIGWIIFIATMALSHLFWMLIEKPSSRIRIFKSQAQ